MIIKKNAAPVVAEGLVEARHQAVSALYFDDSSDFKIALWNIVKALAPEWMDELDSNPSAVFDKSREARVAAHPVAGSPAESYDATLTLLRKTVDFQHTRIAELEARLATATAAPAPASEAASVPYDVALSASERMYNEDLHGTEAKRVLDEEIASARLAAPAAQKEPS